MCFNPSMDLSDHTYWRPNLFAVSYKHAHTLLPSPNTALGAVIWGIVATVIASLGVVTCRRISRQIFQSFIWFARKLPDRYQPALRQGADRIAPTWRKVGGISRPPLESRLRALREVRKPTFALVGGIYYDVTLHPVDLDNLVVGEYSDLDESRKDIGGSAAWVGHYLRTLMDPHAKSYLFSRLGDDANSRDLQKMLKREGWIKKFYQEPAAHAQCGTSYNLEQLGQQKRTTLTHRGSLASFDWRQFLDKLHQKVKHGGIIYISGYFRTNLNQDLTASLETLPAKTIVCIDHGKFQQSDYLRAGAALKQAFSAGLVDVYLCSYSELLGFAESNLGTLATSSSIEEMLTLCHEANLLPPVTVVHGEPNACGTVAYLAYKGDIKVAKLDSPSPGSRLGCQNAFNAGFIYELAHGSPHSSINVALDEAIMRALQAWTATIS